MLTWSFSYLVSCVWFWVVPLFLCCALFLEEVGLRFERTVVVSSDWWTSHSSRNCSFLRGVFPAINRKDIARTALLLVLFHLFPAYLRLSRAPTSLQRAILQLFWIAGLRSLGAGCPSCHLADVVEALKKYIQNHSISIVQVSLCYPASPVKNWRILLEQYFTAHMPLVMATNAFGIGRKCWSSPQHCYPRGYLY